MCVCVCVCVCVRVYGGGGVGMGGGGYGLGSGTSIIVPFKIVFLKKFDDSPHNVQYRSSLSPSPPPSQVGGEKDICAPIDAF